MCKHIAHPPIHPHSPQPPSSPLSPHTGRTHRKRHISIGRRQARPRRQASTGYTCPNCAAAPSPCHPSGDLICRGCSGGAVYLRAQAVGHVVCQGAGSLLRQVGPGLALHYIACLHLYTYLYIHVCMCIYHANRSMTARQLVCGQGQKDTTPPCGCAPALARLVIIGYYWEWTNQTATGRGGGLRPCMPPPPTHCSFCASHHTSKAKEPPHPHSLELWVSLSGLSMRQ